MKTLARALIELVAYLKVAKFDDPDEAQGANELVEWCLIEASPEERQLLSVIARECAREEVAKGSAHEIIRFYEDFASRAEDHQKYG